MDTNKKKIIAGFTLLPVVIWLLGWANPLILLAAVLVFGGILAPFELGRMVFPGHARFEIFLLVAMSFFLCAVTQTGEAEYVLFGLCVVVLLTFGSLLFKERELARIYPSFAAVVTGAVYIGMFAGLVVAMRRLEPGLGGTKLVLMHFALTWSNDAGAFFTGRKWGERKLWPAVSSGKTWEGFAGGVISSILVALVISAISPLWRVGDALVLGVLVGLATPLGDLVESAVKRGAGVKDSGNFLPGHGGVLDRLDSILFPAPIIYFYALIVGPVRFFG